MEKFEGFAPPQRSTPKRQVSYRAAFLLVPLLAFLALYNYVPQARETVQDFFTLENWAELAPRVTLKQGIYVGKPLDEANHPVPVEAFLGVPYALPPVGELRFARPVPLPESNETFQATEYSLR